MDPEIGGSSSCIPSTPLKESFDKRDILTPITNRSGDHSRRVSLNNENDDNSPNSLPTTSSTALYGPNLSRKRRLDQINPTITASGPRSTNNIELVHDPSPGPFARIRRLRHEGLGEVIAARELDLEWITGQSCGRIVVLKVLKKKQIEEEDLENVVFDEFKAYQKIKDSRVAGKMFIMWPVSSFETPEHIAFLMDYFPGTLSDILVKDRGKRQEFKRQWIAQTARGISAIHAIGLIHRDIRPENILVDGNYNLRISGFAHVYVHPNGKVTPDELRSNEITGTWPYMAPEIVKLALQPCKAPYSAAVDYWSLGCIVYELESIKHKHTPIFKEFRDVIRYDAYRAIEMPYPPFEGMSDDAQSLIYRLVCTVPDERMGNTELRQHRYFRNDSGASEFNKLGKAPSKRPADIHWVEMDEETARRPVVYRPLDPSSPSVTEGKIDFSRFRRNHCTEVPLKKRKLERVLFS